MSELDDFTAALNANDEEEKTAAASNLSPEDAEL